MNNESRYSPGRNVLWIASVALIYFAVARLSLLLVFEPSGIAAVWPSSGIFLSAILLTHRELRPWLVGALFITDFIAEMLAGTPGLASLLYALILTGDAVLSFWLLLRFVGEPITFRRVRELVGWLLLSVILSNVLVALAAAATASWLLPGASFWNSWKWWMASDGIGNLLVTPLILSWAAWGRTRRGGWNPKRVLEAAALLILLAFFNSLAFSLLAGQGLFSLLFTYLTFPFLLWAAWRFEVRGAASASLILAGIAIYFASTGRVDVLSQGSSLDVVITVQLYLAIMAAPALFVATVITERKQAEAALRESEERFHSLYENATIGMYRTTPNGLISMANPALLGMLGYQSFEELVQRDLSREGYEPEYPRQDFQQRIEQEGQIFGLESAWKRKDGSTIFVRESAHLVRDEHGQPLYYEGTVEDITERKQAEVALRESEDKFKYVFDYSVVGKSITLLSGEMHVNRAFCEMLGYSQEELQNRKWQVITHPDDIDVTQSVVDALLSGEKAAARFTKRYFHKNGSVVWGDVSTSIRRDEQGKPLYLMTTLVDITARKQAEESLRESVTDLARSQQVGNLGSWNWDVTGNSLVWSDEIYRIWGVGKDFPLTFDTIAGTIHPDDRELNSKMVQELLATRDNGEFEFRIICPDGTVKYIYQNIEVARGPSGQPSRLFGVMQDITRRKRAEEGIDKRNQMLLALHNVAVEIGAKLHLPVLLDSILEHAQALLTADRGGGIYLYEPGENILRLAQGSGINQGCNGITVGMGEGVVGRVFEASKALVVEDYTHWAGRATVLVADPPSTVLGVPLFLKGQVMGVLTLIANSHLRKFNAQDVQQAGMFAAQTAIAIQNAQLYQQAQQEIAERKQVEKALRETSDRLAHMLENSPTVIYALTVKGDQAIPAWISENSESILGFSAEAALQPEWWPEQIYPEDQPKALASLEHLLDDFFQHEYRFLRKDGQVIWVHDEHRLLRNEDNQPREIIGAWTDITQRKQAEEALKKYSTRLESAVEARTNELREAQEQLVRQEKLALLGQLAGGVGHELRNPLAVINNAVYYLRLVQPEANDKIKQYHNMIAQETHNAEKIITDLLDFARIKSVDREPIAVPELIRRVLERFPAPAPVAMKFDFPADLPKVFIDLRQMEQVLGNLTVNACQAMGNGGNLTISAAVQDAFIAIAVKDTGVGIAPENMKKLFEPLFTTKAKGIGLGLAVSRKLVEANGGRIEVESEAGKGSVFTVYLPVRMEAV